MARERILYKFYVHFSDETSGAEWSATYWAENFSDAERQALDTLRSNFDTDSFITTIETDYEPNP